MTDRQPPTRFLGARDRDSAVLSTRVAAPGDIDALGHVNNAVFVRWVQDAAVAHWFAVAGASAQRDMIWVCLRHEIDYREQVLEGQTVEVRTWLGARRGPRFDRHTEIRIERSPRWSARAVTTWVLLDAATRKPRRIGDDLLTMFGLRPEDVDG